MHPGVHLIGSVALADTETVFRALCADLAPWLKRIPDGETGERHRWIYWQREMLLRHPDMEIDPDAEPLSIYQWDGKLIRKERALNKDGRIDVWEYYESGRLVRVGRDKDGDGKPEVFDDAPEPEPELPGGAPGG